MMTEKEEQEYEQEKQERAKKNYYFWFRLISVTIMFLTLFALYMHSVDGVTSVIPEGDAINGKYVIDCLGEDNELFIYALDEESKDSKLIYQSKCDVFESVKEQYIYQAIKLVIKNGEESDYRINYEEYFDTIHDSKINIKMDSFTDKVCFTIKSKKYVDVIISNDKQEQVKDYYKCFDKKSITQGVGRDESSKIVEIYINDELRDEFVINKPKEPIKLSFIDLGMIDDKVKDKINVKITNPTGNVVKMKVLDTNLDCHTKSFTMSSNYKLLCNKTKDVKSFYVQLQSGNKKVYYGEYTIPPKRKKESSTNYKLWGVIAVVVFGFLVYKNYVNKSKDRDKTAIQQLEEKSDNGTN